jgi:adenylate cyclase
MGGKVTMKLDNMNLKVSLPAAFFLFIGTISSIIMISSFVSSSKSVNQLAQEILVNIGESTLDKSITYLETAAKLARVNTSLLNPDENGDIDLDSFNQITREEIQTYPQFALVYFGNKHGNHWLNKPSPAGNINTRVIKRLDDSEEGKRVLQEASKMAAKTDDEKKVVADMIAPYIKTTWRYRDQVGDVLRKEIDPLKIYDPRERPWYKGAVENGGQFWTDVYTWASDGGKSYQVGITVAELIKDKTGLVGVTAIDIILNDISEFLSGLKIGKTGQAFLMDSQGRVIGLKDFNQVVKTNADGSVSIKNISEIEDKTIIRSYKVLRAQLKLGANAPLAFNGAKQFTFEAGNQDYLAYYRPFGSDHKLDWVIGIVVPANDFLGEINDNMLKMAFFSIFCVVIVIIISVRLSKKITDPLNQLAEEANQIRVLDLEGASMEKTIFDELNQVADSFSKMKIGLRSFRKYVPTDLVVGMIQSGQEANLGGKKENVTIFFSDIAGFTSMSEKLTPEQLVKVLGDYLGAMSDIIMKREGTLDKYIGDAIMAFWNAPKPVDNHAVSACYAAIENQQKLAEMRIRWMNEDLPPIGCRIGLHTGVVVVGNFGSEKRLNYTIIGDPVNLAARLESACKQYNIDIMISEETYLAAKDFVEVRLLDNIAVKGKKEGVFVYELLGRKGKLIQEMKDFSECYEQALTAYNAREWDNAIALFEKAEYLKRKDDPASQKLAEKCKAFKANPPEAKANLWATDVLTSK